MSESNLADAAARRATHVPADGVETVPAIAPRGEQLLPEGAPPVPPLPGAAGAVPDAADDESAPASAKRPSRKPFVIGLAIIAVLAIGGWAAFGVTLGQLSSTNDALADTQSDLESATARATSLDSTLDTVTDERDRLRSSVTSVEQRESAVATKESELKTREAAVKAAEDYKKETTLLDGYSYSVGLTMEAGTYRTTSTSSRCYWVIYRSGTNYSDIVENDYGPVGTITVKLSKKQDFQSQDCGDWAKVG